MDLNFDGSFGVPLFLVTRAEITEDSAVPPEATHDITPCWSVGWACEQCGKTFRKRRSLNLHMRTHSGIKPFRCEICDKRFLWSSSLTRHFKVHTKEKPYECRVCRKRYTQSGTLYRHLRIHISRENLFFCQQCPKVYRNPVEIEEHVRENHPEDAITIAEAKFNDMEYFYSEMNQNHSIPKDFTHPSLNWTHIQTEPFETKYRID